MGDLHGRLIAFDLDGTLVDSRRDLADSANALIIELGGRPLAEAAIGRMVGEGAKVLVDRALRAAGILPPESGSHERESLEGGRPEPPGGASGFSRKALDRFLQIYDARLLNHTRAYDGIEEAVAVARREARLAVLTNKPLRATERILAGLHLRAMFDTVVGGDGAWPRKPDPSSLRELMHEAGATPATTLLIGDSAIDHETATRAGVACCLATYGFGFETFPNERLTGSEWIVRTPAELVAVITSFSTS